MMEFAADDVSCDFSQRFGRNGKRPKESRF